MRGATAPLQRITDGAAWFAPFAPGMTLSGAPHDFSGLIAPRSRLARRSFVQHEEIASRSTFMATDTHPELEQQAAPADIDYRQRRGSTSPKRRPSRTAAHGASG